MNQPRVKGQALALVLIIVVVSVIIGFAVTNRIILDVQQQSQERASTRAETIAESAIDNITQKIEAGEIVATNNNSTVSVAISTQAPANTTVTQTLGLCDPTQSDLSKQCDANSLAKISYFNQIVQFKVFNSENIEVPLVSPTSTTPLTNDRSAMIVHVKKNPSFDEKQSSFMIKGFARVAVNGKPELRVVSECVWQIDQGTASCLPDQYLTVAKIDTCPQVGIDTDQNSATASVNTVLGDYCIRVQSKTGSGISFYRVKPLLKGGDGTSPAFIDVSATGLGTPADTSLAPYQLPVPQMALINAGVYSGNTGSAQQVFQQSTRLVLLSKAVPEVADYVLYNGSENPIEK